jgi:hypothetical protein
MSRFAQLEPRHFRPLGERHQVNSQVIGRRFVPLAAINAPLERRTHKLESDAVPYLVFARAFQVELVREQAAICGQVFGDFISVDADVDPLAFRQELRSAPTGGFKFQVARRGIFRLKPHGIIVLGVRH